MKKVVLYVLLSLVVVFVILQFVGPTRPEVRTDNPKDLMAMASIDSKVADLLKSACYDCHSMETNYPWYANVAPVSWRLFDHIEEGREELNFSEWGTLGKVKKIRKLKDVAEEVEEGKMPLDDYVTWHPEAKLSEDQKNMLVEWANSFAREVMKQ